MKTKIFGYVYGMLFGFYFKHKVICRYIFFLFLEIHDGFWVE